MSKCGKYTKSIHDKLKPIVLKYVKAFEFLTYVVLIKRRFICHDCKYKFTEPVTIQRENKSISNKVEQKVLIDLKQYNLSLKYIAETNNNAESSQRGVKVKQKNGKFRSEDGANNYLIIKSFILSCKKQNIDILNTISDAFSNKVTFA